MRTARLYAPGEDSVKIFGDYEFKGNCTLRSVVILTHGNCFTATAIELAAERRLKAGLREPVLLHEKAVNFLRLEGEQRHIHF